MKYIIKRIIMVVILSACLYWLVGFMNGFIDEHANMQSVKEIISQLSAPVLVFLSTAIVTVISFLNYKKPALTADEYETKEQEYIAKGFSTEQKAIVQAMSDEDKKRFFEEMKKLQSEEVKRDMDNTLSQYRFAYAPNTLIWPKRIVLMGCIALIAYLGYDIYQKVGPEYQAYLAAEEAKRNEVISDQTLSIEGLPPIELHSNNTFKKLQIERYIEENIKTQPAYLLANCKVIKLYGDGLFKNTFQHDAYGISFYPEMSVALNCEIGADEVTLAHELSHVYDFINGNGWASNSPEFQNLWMEFKNNFHFPNEEIKFQDEDSAEFFAIASSAYLKYSDYLKQDFEPLYNYFANLYAQ